MLSPKDRASSEYITPAFIGVGALIGALLGLISNGRYIVDFACCVIVLTAAAVLYLRHRHFAFFRVRLHGDQICVLSEDRNPPITGFFTTRFITAHSTDEAAEKAKSIVLKDWTSGRYAADNLNYRSAPRLAIMELSKASLFTWLLANNTEHSFYGPEDGEL